VGPVYSPAESKENSVAYNNSYDTAAVVTTGAVPAAGAGIATTDVISKGGDLNAYIYTMPGYVVKGSENKRLQVRVSLTGGAKFVKSPSLICVHSGLNDNNPLGVASGGATWDAIETLPDPLVMPADTKLYILSASTTTLGVAAYNFIFPEGFAVSNGGSGACLLSLSGVGAKAVALAAGAAAFNPALTLPANASDVSLNVDVTYDDFFTQVVKSTAISMISFVTAYRASFDGGDPITIDVGALSKKFLLGSTKEYGGTFTVSSTVDSAGNVRKLRNATGFTLSATDVLSGASVTISGPTIATLSKVMLSSGRLADCASMILESAPAAVTGGASDSVTIAIPNGSQSYYSLVSAINADGTDGGHNGLNLCLVAEGNTKVMTDGYVTITVNGTTPVGKVVELGSSPADFLRVKRNGTVVRVLNVPGDPADPYRVNIRMYNTSSQTVNNIMGTLHGVDGKLIADNIILAPSLAPNNVKLITSDSLVTLVGKTWTGRAWMIIQAPVDPTGFKVQVLVKQPSGVLGNISTDATD